MLSERNNITNNSKSSLNNSTSINNKSTNSSISISKKFRISMKSTLLPISIKKTKTAESIINDGVQEAIGYVRFILILFLFCSLFIPHDDDDNYNYNTNQNKILSSLSVRCTATYIIERKLRHCTDPLGASPRRIEPRTTTKAPSPPQSVKLSGCSYFVPHHCLPHV